MESKSKHRGLPSLRTTWQAFHVIMKHISLVGAAFICCALMWVQAHSRARDPSAKLHRAKVVRCGIHWSVILIVFFCVSQVSLV